jgi:hypothetical protein
MCRTDNVTHARWLSAHRLLIYNCQILYCIVFRKLSLGDRDAPRLAVRHKHAVEVEMYSESEDPEHERG